MPAKKVLVIGWDAADWKVITPLIDAGKMPHLGRLASDGAMGNLATLYPVLSPMLWTSIATGKRAHKHGIHGFAEPDPETGGVRPVTNLGRGCKALWNILNQNGLKSHVVGWWPSHPAEPINGVMVSNHFQQANAPRDKPWLLPPGAIFPPRLIEPLKRLRVHPAEIQGDQILPFIPRAAEVDLAKDKRVAGVARILAETAGVQAAATALMQLEPWDFMGVYFDAIDHFCHGYMRYRAPRLAWIEKKDFELYKDVVDTAYQFHDLMLGTLMQLAGEDTTVILVSDHGFHPDHLRPRELPNEPAGPADERRPYGVFAMKGPGVKKDALVFGATLLDVTPTILTLFGLPVGRDMDGKPLLNAFEAPPGVQYVDSWEEVPGEAGTHPPGVRVDPIGSQEALEQLAELGYIEKPEEDRRGTVARTVRELRFNLARDYFGAARYPQAIELFEALWREYPDESRFGVKLIESHLALGHAPEARAALERLVMEKERYAREARAELERLAEEFKDRKEEDFKPDEITRINQLRRKAAVNEHALAFLRGRVLQAEGEHDQALEQFSQAAEVQVHNRPSLLRSVAESLIALGRWNDAEARFREILAIDPVNPHAHLGLARCHLGRRRPRLARNEALAALGLAYHNPMAHYYCGMALRWLGQREEAIQAFETAVAQNPVFPDAHRELSDLHRKLGRPQEALEHQRLALAAQQRIRAFRAGKGMQEDEDLEVDVNLAHVVTVGERGGGQPLPPLGREIVIVSGLPRSGTSMMMQMLAAGGLPVLTDEMRGADEDNPRGYFELEEVKKLTSGSAWLEKARGRAVKVVAQLLPYLHGGETYRVIFMERPLGEIIDSQAAMLARLGKEQGNRRRLARTYMEQVGRVRLVLDAYRDRVAVLAVNYHTALSDPKGAAARVNAFLGGGLDVQAMAEAVDPKLRRQFGVV